MEDSKPKMKEEDKKKRITFTLDPSLIEKLKAVSKKTLIPQSRLVERALEEIVEKYNKEK